LNLAKLLQFYVYKIQVMIWILSKQVNFWKLKWVKKFHSNYYVYDCIFTYSTLSYQVYTYFYFYWISEIITKCQIKLEFYINAWQDKTCLIPILSEWTLNDKIESKLMSSKYNHNCLFYKYILLLFKWKHFSNLFETIDQLRR